MKSTKENVLLLGIVSLLNDLSSEIILPILPFFLKSLNASNLSIGLVGGIIDGMSNIVKAISGYISDKIKRRKLIVFIGYTVSQFSKMGLSFSYSPISISSFVTLDRIGKGIRTSPRDAIIAESTKNRGRAFGLHRMMDTSGAVFGTIFAIILIESFGNFRQPIFFAAILGFIALIPLFFVKDTGMFVKSIELGLRLRKYLIAISFIGLSHVSYMFFLLKASQISVEFSIVLYLLYNIVYATFSYPIGVLADKYGRERMLSLAYLFFSFASILMLTSFVVSFIVAFILYGFFMSISEAQQRALASDIAKAQGFGIGSYHFFFGISSLIGNLIAGILAQLYFYEVVFVYSFIMSTLSAVLYAFMKF